MEAATAIADTDADAEWDEELIEELNELRVIQSALASNVFEEFASSEVAAMLDVELDALDVAHSLFTLGLDLR